MDMPHAQSPRKTGPIKKLLIKWVAGADEQILNKFPVGEEDIVITGALINCGLWGYQVTIFSFIGHRLFAEPGRIHFEIIAMALGLATFVLLFDAYAINRAGFYQLGAFELARAGLTGISGGWLSRLKNWFFYITRLVLSAGLAQATALVMLVLFLARDIDTRILQSNRNNNAHLVIAATKPVEDEIARAADAVTDQKARVSALTAHVTRLQAGEVDPAAADPQVQQAQQEVADLAARKNKLDEELAARELFRNKELGGVVGDGNSGRAGHGPRHRAAMAQVEDTRAHLSETTHALDMARTRLDTLRKQQQGIALETARQQAHDQLPVFEARLREESEQLANLNVRLAQLSNGRGEAIRASLEKLPDYVPPDNGLLAQIRTLDEIVRANPRLAAVVAILELVGFGFELAAIFAKMCFIPSLYARTVTADAYVSAVRMVDAIVKELNPEPEEAEDAPEVVMTEPPANDNWPPNSRAVGQNPLDGIDIPPPPPPSSPKRPRGRPRKTPRPTEH